MSEKDESCGFCDSEFLSERKRIEHELAEHGEEMSSHDKNDRKSELNRLEQKRKTEKQNRRDKIKYGSVLGVMGIILIGGGYLAMKNADSLGPTTNASIGVGQPVHWHADYTIRVCGENKIPRGGPMLAHTHGETKFHLEGVRQSREQATLGWVLDQLGVEMTENSIYGKTSCNGEPANLTVKANGENLEKPQEYIIRDGDSIQIKLG